MSARFIVGDTRAVLASLPAGSVDLVLSSPPFLALRSYLPDDHADKALEIGSEPTPGEFIDTLLDVTEACARVLAPHGTLAFELGDTYSGSGGAGGDYAAEGLRDGQAKFTGSAAASRARPVNRDWGRSAANPSTRSPAPGWPLDKSLCLVAESYRWALAYGRNPFTGRETDRWRVRNVVRWVRPNPPVGALGDKFRPATSDLVIACKARDRWFDLDAVRVPSERPPYTDNRGGHIRDEVPGRTRQVMNPVDEDGHRIQANPAGAPPLDWWSIPPGGYPGSHYAVFPPDLCVKPIEAMCPRRVCLTCGKPSRRETRLPTELRDRHPEFAALVRNARTRAGLSQHDVDEHFGHNGMCSHWERQTKGDKAQPAYPTPEQWPRLRQLLAIADDSFDGLIEGWRGWSDRDMSPEYREAIERTRSQGFYASTGNDGMARVGVNGRSRTAEYTTTGWSTCGCPGTDGIRIDGYHTGTGWRPGIVLDPFAGSGTTLMVATGHGRDAIGIDLDERNADLARERIGMFLDVDYPAVVDVAVAGGVL